ncbi:arginase family protein [Glycomyces buryatensis]|uniref:Arginase family protein n=1 Tax=Glycomyces buryatensis TaxID=2570927 RepID=A0A4S8Q9Y0_9ACTN|nr:arginase family protein [Glycomyces buryatensis]THV39555.1 arginase family protein [Glycomyces buryatensis]
MATRSKRVAVLDAPSNLGLRPPTPHTVPGCAKAPGALRDHRIIQRLNAIDAGCLTPPRFDPSGWRPGDGVGQAEAIAEYTRSLADRVERLWRERTFPLVLGGDCSIMLGPVLAARRRTERDGEHRGLIFVDAHADFRHPGNSQYVGAAAAEELALATGRGQPDLTDIGGLRPYVDTDHLVMLGLRADDPHRVELEATGVAVRTVPTLRAGGVGRSAEWALDALGDVATFWLHVDADVLDPSVMPAVDGPAPGGISLGELGQIIATCTADERCSGMELTVFDPDYDPDGEYAKALANTLVEALQ